MMAGCSSWSHENDAKINYTKLSRLLIDGGTRAVRSVFDGINPPSSLKAVLNRSIHTKKLQNLRKPKGKVLNDEQWDKLYPSSGSDPKSQDFDITLLFVLLRNICALTPPVYEITPTGKQERSWDKLPLATENSQEANLVRIKYYRNNTIAHKPNTEINDADFEQYWQDISSALLSLRLSQDNIDELKSARLGEKDYNQLLYDWYVSDEDITSRLVGLGVTAMNIKSDTSGIRTNTEVIKSDTSHIKSHTEGIKSDTTHIKSHTEGIKSDTAHIKSHAEGIKSDTTDIKSHAEGIKSDTTDIKSHAEGIKSDTTDIKSHAEGIKSDTTEIKSHSEGIKSDTTHIKSHAEGIKSDTTDIKSHAEGIKSDTTDIKSHAEGIKSDTTDIKSHAEGIKSDTTDIKSHAEGIKSDTTDIKSHAEGIKSDTTDIKSHAEGIKSDTTEIKSHSEGIKSDTTHIKSQAEGIKSNAALIPDIKDDLSELLSIMLKNTQSQTIAKLAKDEFRSLIESLCKSFQSNTRQWILDLVNCHINNDDTGSRVLIIEAGPGMGKSTLAGKICDIYKGLGSLGGCHFFQFSNSTRNNPRLMLQSIASQICDSVPGYKEALEEKLQTSLGRDLTDKNCEELFTVLFEEPLCNVKLEDLATSNKFVVVLDAIDECCSHLKYELQAILMDKLSLLPSWLRFVITTRPSPILNNLPMNRIVVDPNCEENEIDIENFYKAKFSEHYCNVQDSMIKKLVKMSGGLFLVAFFVVDYMQKENITSPSYILDLFPKGISSVYKKYFQRLKDEILPFISEEESFFKMLGAITSSKNPIPVGMIYSILGLKRERDVPRQKRKTRKDALKLLHSLFPAEYDHVSVFHKTVADWLVLEGDREHEFSVRVEDGIEVLARQCYDAMDDIRSGKKELDKPLEVTDIEKYALNSGWDYLKNSMLKDKVDEMPRNHFVLSAMICTGVPFEINTDDLNKCKLLMAFNKFGSRFHSHRHTGFGTTCSCFAFHHLLNHNFGHCVEFLLSADLAIGTEEIASDKVPLRRHNFSYYDTKADLHMSLYHGRPHQTTSVEFRTSADLAIGNKEKDFGILDLLSSHNFSYYETKRSVMEFPHQTTSDCPSRVILCDNDFVLLAYDYDGSLFLQGHQMNGSLLAQKQLPGKKHICPSPDHRFVIATGVSKEGDIEIRDSRTLNLVSRYNFPYEIMKVDVCGEQPWYILANCSNDEIHVIEGETGQTCYRIPIDEEYKIEATSRNGQMLIGNSKYDEEHLLWYRPPSPSASFTSRQQELCHTLYLRHVLYASLKLPISPIREKVCYCTSCSGLEIGNPVCFSQDGHLFAYRVRSSIFIHKASDGSQYKLVFLGSRPHYLRILFISESYVVVLDSTFQNVSSYWHRFSYCYCHEVASNLASLLSIINIQTNEVVHRFLIPEVFGAMEFHVVPRIQGEPFTLLGYDRKTKCITQYVFHNLDL